ncbi:ATP-binding protein [Ancylothrix sp. C2]|uniref:ATP-binding protein n=1 Tax=Ancylothrix sp. D3o TaxID=2953691 RepID=UPI0021BAB3B1|nr:ATP-binding protein [Ancylothrix sp. D3o]MCT7948763.1 ATP-binding protein [Ancylothrix sp. D3o]
MLMPKTPTILSVENLNGCAASLLLYQGVCSGEMGQSFLNFLSFLQQLNPDKNQCLQAYGSFFRALAAENISWQNYLMGQILIDENPFSFQAQKADFREIPAPLIAAAKHDLEALQSLYECTCEEVSRWVQGVFNLENVPVFWPDEPLQNPETPKARMMEILRSSKSWADTVEKLAAYYRQYGTGIFAQYIAFRWQAGEFVSIKNPDVVRLENLTGYELQKEALLKNTEFLLAGFPALHVLLYGSRGSGKSSLVKALLNEYGERGLRLIEVSKADLKDLPLIVEKLRNVPQKFIIFVDDLSFEEDDDAFKSLKVVLEGSLTARPQNVVVYATSNRRHLIREFFDDRPRPKDSDEIHAWDTVQEKLSFSDRFGLTLTFEPANQDTYLTIVQHLSEQANIPLSWEQIKPRALQWATRHNGRSGRTARQFVDFLTAEIEMSKNP